MRRVLIVEDEVLIALDLAEQLEEAGFEVLGPAVSVAAALELIKSIGCDSAVLDVNLGKETSEPVAQQLVTLGIPFIVLSGYSTIQHAPIFSSAPKLRKPAAIEELVALLRQ